MTIELGNRLADLRKQHGYSQEELADKLGVSRQAISKWERGEASPDTDNLIELAKIYDISLDELLGLNPSNKKEENDEDKENKEEEKKDHIFISDEGIRISSEDGEEVHIGGDGLKINGEKVKVLKKKEHRINAFISTFTVFGVVIAYILLGTLLGLWAQAWVLFLLIPIVPSLVNAIQTRRASHFAYPVFIAFAYLLTCCWILNFRLWHPLWVLFLTIPVYYGFVKLFERRDDDDNDDDDDDSVEIPEVDAVKKED